MKIIDQTSKTNWKFIAIVAVLGLAVGSWIWWLFIQPARTPQDRIEVYNQSGQPLNSVTLRQGGKTQVVIPKSITQQNQSPILAHDNSPCAFESLDYDYYLDIYTVKKGDTLFSIARYQSGSTSRVNELIQLNQEKHPSLSITNPFIEVGWELYVPPKFQKSTMGKLHGLKGRIVDQNQSAFQIGTSSSMPVGSLGLLAFKRDITKYFGKDTFKIGDCVSIIIDDHSKTLAISPQDKNYFKETQQIDMSGWQTYRNDEFGFEVRYPEDWVIKPYPEYVAYFDDNQARTTTMVITSLNNTVRGISYCEAYPEDTSRCEKLQGGKIPMIIDWDSIIPDKFSNIPIPRSASALVNMSNEVALNIVLNDLTYEMSLETRRFFRTFLSTFRFTD